MNKVRELYEVTLRLINVLEGQLDREDKIIMIEDTLELREDMLKNVKTPYTEEEQLLGTQLIELNKKLEILLVAEKLFIQKDIRDLNERKKTSQKYANPYQSLSTDGMFYDRKK